MTTLVPFAIEGKNGLVNSLFHSNSTCQNVGGPIRLHCVSDVIHGNNRDQEKLSDHDSMQGTRLCRELGYAGVNPDHESLSGISWMVGMCF